MSEREEHQVVSQLIPAYAIGATEADETALVEQHIRHCEACRALLADYTQLSDMFLYTVPLVAAPATLEERLLAQIAPPQPSDIKKRSRSTSPARFLFPRWQTWAAIAAVVLLFFTNAYWMARLTRVKQEAALQATAIAFLADAQRVQVTGDTLAPDAGGILIFQPDTSIALLHLDHLPPLPEGKAYQVWLIRNGHRDSGAVFRVRGEKEITVLIRAPRPLGEYEAIGITVEPEGGSPRPTGPRVIKGRIIQQGGISTQEKAS